MKFHLFHKKPVDPLSEEDKTKVVQAIREAERLTSGEIRVYMEPHCKYVDPIDRAREVFFELKMEKTVDRNAVLLYVAIKDHQLAIFGDEGIYQKTGKEFWDDAVAKILRHFNREDFAAGISEYIYAIGETLRTHFPYDRASDHNELPDDIVFGR